MVMLAKTDNPLEVGLHVFEKAGLGKAPFRCTGFYEKVYKASPDSPAQPGGTCDFCGTGIMLHCAIKSADGKAFKVGSDCVRRTGDAGLIRSYKSHPDVRKAAAAKRKIKDAAVEAEWAALIEAPATVEKLSKVFLDRAWLPGGKISYLDEFKRCWGMCGAAGRARWLKKLKGAVA